MSLIWLAFFLACGGAIFTLLFEHSILLVATQRMIENSKNREYLIEGLLQYGIEFIKSRNFNIDMPMQRQVSVPFSPEYLNSTISFQLIEDNSEFKIIKLEAYVYNYLKKSKSSGLCVFKIDLDNRLLIMQWLVK